jgi:hypothetical protein
MHVVWTEFYYPESWPPHGVFYSRSIDGGSTWSVPKVMAQGGFDQININVVDDNNIHVVWNGAAGTGGRYHRWSSDGGQTWSDTEEVIPAGLGGTEGLPQLVSDQSGTVHMLTTHLGGCLWYTYLANQIWMPPSCISGERTLIEEPSLTVSEGNKLHAVFWDNRESLWYTTGVTNAPAILPEKMKDQFLQSTIRSAATEIPRITPTLISTTQPLDQQIFTQSRTTNSGRILLLSLASVLLFVVWIVALGFFKKTK